MTNTKPTIVIIHGAGHTPAHYSKLTNGLRAAGYEVHCPRMLSVNKASPPNADLYTDTALIHSYVESLVEAGRTVVPIMHSYGGHVGTNALHGLGLESRKKTKTTESPTGGISHLIYLCAYALPEGRSMFDKVREHGHEELIPLALDFAEDKSMVFRDLKGMVGAHPGIDEAEVDAYIDSVVVWNGTCMYQELEHCAWREIPVSYVLTDADVTVPYVYQKSMVDYMQKEGVKVQTFELEGGHCPYFTMPEKVVDIVNTIVAPVE